MTSTPPEASSGPAPEGPGRGAEHGPGHGTPTAPSPRAPRHPRRAPRPRPAPPLRHGPQGRRRRRRTGPPPRHRPGHPAGGVRGPGVLRWRRPDPVRRLLAAPPRGGERLRSARTRRAQPFDRPHRRGRLRRPRAVGRHVGNVPLPLAARDPRAGGPDVPPPQGPVGEAPDADRSPRPLRPPAVPGDVRRVVPDAGATTDPPRARPPTRSGLDHRPAAGRRPGRGPATDAGRGFRAGVGPTA